MGTCPLQPLSPLRTWAIRLLCACLPVCLAAQAASLLGPLDVPVRGASSLNQPVAVWNNWPAHDELSDKVELTEKLAMRELCEILRLSRDEIIVGPEQLVIVEVTGIDATGWSSLIYAMHRKWGHSR